MKRPTAYTFTWLSSLMAALLAPGCLLGNNNDPPELAIDVYWEIERARFGTCTTAHVATMAWQLTDLDGKLIAENEDTEQARDCQVGFAFVDVGPGDYIFKVTGQGRDQGKAWQGTCRVSLGRFDRVYECEVNLVSPPRTPPNDEDAGT